jgi:hypothetical protein
MSEDVASLTERVLTFLHLCEEERAHAFSVPLKGMDGALPLDLGAATRTGQDDAFLIPPNDGPPAVWPLDVCVCTEHRSDFGHITGSLQFRRFRSIGLADARKQGAVRFSTKMMMDEAVIAKPDGGATSGSMPLALMGGRWAPAAPTDLYVQDAGRFLNYAPGLALALRYEWTVWLGHNEGPRVRMLTDPVGAREVFRLRDLPPGRQRRAALKHWVTGHWRQKRTETAADRAWIGQHLRGATDFAWNGLRCRIQPPDYDVERLAALKKAAPDA